MLGNGLLGSTYITEDKVYQVKQSVIIFRQALKKFKGVCGNLFFLLRQKLYNILAQFSHIKKYQMNSYKPALLVELTNFQQLKTGM